MGDKIPASYKIPVLSILGICIASSLVSLYLNYKYFDDVIEIIAFPLVTLWGCHLIYAYLFNQPMFAKGATDPDSNILSNRGFYFFLGFALIALSLYGTWFWGDR